MTVPTFHIQCGGTYNTCGGTLLQSYHIPYKLWDWGTIRVIDSYKVPAFNVSIGRSSIIDSHKVPIFQIRNMGTTGVIDSFNIPYTLMYTSMGVIAEILLYSYITLMCTVFIYLIFFLLYMSKFITFTIYSFSM